MFSLKKESFSQSLYLPESLVELSGMPISSLREDSFFKLQSQMSHFLLVIQVWRNLVQQFVKFFTDDIPYQLGTTRRIFEGKEIKRSSKVPFKIIENSNIYRRNSERSSIFFILFFANMKTSVSINVSSDIRKPEHVVHMDIIHRFKLKSNRKLDKPTEITRQDVDNVERVLLGRDARTMIEMIEAEDKFGTGPVRDAFIALASTDITSDLQRVTDVKLTNQYPSQAGLRPEEYCSISRFRFFISSRGIKNENASMDGETVYKIPMYGVESAAKIEQNGYTARLGYRPPWVVSSVGQNSQLYAKFAIARAITNQNWVSGLEVTQAA